MVAITRVWIEQGCIVCHACEQACPTVFRVDPYTTIIRGDAREDGVDSMNEERGALLAALREEHADAIVEAAEGCPCDVIRYEVES